MEPSPTAHLDDLLAAERYQDALAAAEAALERLAQPTNGGPVGSNGGFHRAFDLRFVALRAAYALGHEVARRHAFEALKLAQEADDADLQARSHNALAALDGSDGLYDKALEHLWTVVHLRERAGARVAPQELNNLGNVYLELGRHDEAAAFFERAVEGFRAEDDATNTALALTNQANARHAAGQPVEALPRLNEALTTFERLGTLGPIVFTLVELGRAQAATDQPARARASFERALGLVAEGHGTRHETAARVAYARLALDLGDAATAVAQLEPLAAGHGADRGPRDLLPLLSRALEAVGRTSDALAALRRHVDRLEHDAGQAAAAATQVRLLELEFGAGGDQEVARLRALELERVNATLGRKAAELERLSLTDALTGLPNRRAFDARLDDELARARRHGRPLVLALVDLDRFKEVNDRHGHPVGDAVLRRAAVVVREALRASDVAARWGGEEFALLLPDTPHEEAYRVLERVRAALAAASWGDLGADLALTASIGAAASAETDDVHELLRRADHRLFAAKRAGRDRTLVADPT